MSPLSAFIFAVIAITIQLWLFTLRRLRGAIVGSPTDNEIVNFKSSEKRYWVNAELTNGRLAMMGF